MRACKVVMLEVCSEETVFGEKVLVASKCSIAQPRQATVRALVPVLDVYLHLYTIADVYRPTEG